MKLQMRKILTLLFLVLFAKDSNANVNMDVIKEIEGGGCRSNASCIGDNGLAVSYWQLHKGVIDDYNRAFGTKYMAKIRENEEKAKHIANWYMNFSIPKMLKHKGTPVTLESQLTAWNMGIGNAWKGRVATAYVNKYKSIAKRKGIVYDRRTAN